MKRRQHDYQPRLRMATVCCLLAVVALSLGPTGERVVRSTVRDAAAPGYALQRHLSRWQKSLDFARWPWSAGERQTVVVQGGDDQRERVIALEQENRELRAALAIEEKKFAIFEASLGPVSLASGERSTGVTRRAARVLDRSKDENGPAGVIIETGRLRGVEANAIAVSAIRLAAGFEDELSDGDTVLAGASVVGRVQDVGAWTSTVIPVTDQDFRAHVWIVHDSQGETSFGDEGILEGDGVAGCRLKYVPSTAAVAVGDHVYSRDPSGRIPQPLYYGEIDRAELRPGAPHWEIRVRPVVDLANVPVVHVLIANEASPAALAANQ